MKKSYRFTVLLHLLLLFVLGLPMLASAAQLRVSGIVRDSLTHESIPFVAVFLQGTEIGTLSDDNGKFSIITSASGDSLRFSVMGYATKSVPVALLKEKNNKIELVPTGVMLTEVVVKPKKEKYSKKNNPAVAFLERIRAAQELTDPKRHDYYNYEKYERLTMALNDFKIEGNYKWLGKKFDFIKEHVDTSELSGKPILNFIVKEKTSDVHYRKNPESEKEYVLGMTQDGVDDLVNQEGTRAFLEDVFREIDIYQNDITLLQNRFVSPLSKIAPDFYKFYLTDTVVVDNDSCVVLSFVPHTPQTWGFIGKIYVPKNDSTMFIKKLEMFMPKSINVNLLDGMQVNQTFVKSDDGTRIKVKDDMIMEFSLLPGLPKLYARRNTAYANHDFEEPEDEDVFEYLQYQIVDDSAETRDDEFWANRRLVPMHNGEGSVSTLLTQLRSVPVYYWAEKTLRLLVTGYVPTGNPSKFDYGPVNTSVSYNSVDGIRLRVGGMTTAALSKHWFTRGFVAYGLRSHTLNYKVELEYSFNEKKNHSREFPIHSLKFTSLYLQDDLGQKYQFTNQDNIFLSFKRMSDKRVTYRRSQSLDYTLELMNNFSVIAGLEFDRQEQTQWIRFTNGYGQNFGHYNEALFSLKLRYAPGEKFYQGRSNRHPINLDVPVIELTHTYAPKGFLGSMFNVNRTEIRYSQRYWLSAFGYIDAVLKAGHVWQAAPYMYLLLPNCNLSYTIQPESFSLMNPLEFINDSYAAVDVTYWMNGLIFSRIPLINKLRLREVMSFKALWGHLSKKNNPRYHNELFTFPEDVHTIPMTNEPYMEISAGIDNIFEFLRVDSVWRLSYRNVSDAPKWGIRIAAHFAF